MLIDIAAIQRLYGKNLSTNRGDTVYRWQPGKTFIETIYDVGGTDTINAQNQRQSVAINLEPGQFSLDYSSKVKIDTGKELETL